MNRPPATAVEVLPPGGGAGGELAAPTSKSVTNRLLVVAALADGRGVVRDPLESDDSAVMRRAIGAFGAEVHVEPGVWHVAGTGGRPSSPAGPVSAGRSVR